MTNDFTLFGPAHLQTLGLLALVGVAAVLTARRAGDETRRRLRLGLAFALVGCHLTEYSVALRQGWYRIQMLPLEMCDLAAAFGIYALLARDPRAAGPAWFFALSGTLPALITPELNVTFPHVRFVVYFLEHGLTVITPLVLVIGLGIVPPAGAWFRAALVLNAFAAFNGVLNVTLGTNFMYLSHKPYGPTPYDWFPPWPAYIGVLEVLVLVLFRLLQVPLSALDRGRIVDES
ncbi:MAG TPA: TIGR02206 family membrane protein [Vicinamibacteria bacterium]|nr:TIGR02206 family membrane protein [Vicinamibacteria bacterium]